MKLSLKFKAEDLTRIFDKAMKQIFSQANMAKWMQETADDIKKRTRLGYGVDKNLQAKSKLEALDPKYIKWRKGDSSRIVIGKTKKGKNRTKIVYNRLSDKTAPAKSNLTLSGQMLDALRGRSDGPGQGTIYLEDQRSNDKFGNNELAGWNEKRKKRIFMRLSDLEYKRLVQKIEKELTATIRKTFKT